MQAGFKKFLYFCQLLEEQIIDYFEGGEKFGAEIDYLLRTSLLAPQVHYS